MADNQSNEDQLPRHDRFSFRNLDEAQRQTSLLEDALIETRERLAATTSSNEKLAAALQQTRTHVIALRHEVDKLSQPPSSYGSLDAVNEDGTIDVISVGRKLRVALHPDLDPAVLRRGDEVVLNEHSNVIAARNGDASGEVVVVKELLADHRVVVAGRSDEERVLRMADVLTGESLRSGDYVVVNSASQLVVERLERQDAHDLTLEEVPNLSYADIGGLDTQIEQIRDAVELPYLHPELFRRYELPAPKGILLYGPPGCGKTLIAKAVAHSLAEKVAAMTGNDHIHSYFLTVKGPELLNKYVGETERRIRTIFQRARDKAAEGVPVIIFFDEMDSLFRTRGTGISSDMESTVVPQLLAEIDGVESLRDVIVIGATNREDLIDPAILRPGRLDVKIKIERPGPEGAAQIFERYLHAGLPISADVIQELGGGDVEKAVRLMIEQTVEHMYRDDDENRFLEVTYQGGDKEVLHYKDFASGAMIENIVRRAKKIAVKRVLDGAPDGIRPTDLLASIRQEYHENEDLPNTTNPDDWARISGKKGERIVFIRTLLHDDSTSSDGGRSIPAVGTGQYL